MSNSKLDEQNNSIGTGVKIDSRVVLGRFNVIEDGVEIIFVGRKSMGKIELGDCNQIKKNARILVGDEGIHIGDWNVFHQSMLILGGKRLEVGHNCWFGQNTVLDASGGLRIGNGVRVGMYSQIWTHVASGEIIEGCTLFGERETILEDDAWLVGSCTVSSGVRVGARSICLAGSNIVADTMQARVYAGVPAKLKPELNYWKVLSRSEKIELMLGWSEKFCEENIQFECEVKVEMNTLIIFSKVLQEVIKVGFNLPVESSENISFFDLESKKYTKKLGTLERQFYRYIYNHKARFLPGLCN